MENGKVYYQNVSFVNHFPFFFIACNAWGGRHVATWRFGSVKIWKNYFFNWTFNSGKWQCRYNCFIFYCVKQRKGEGVRSFPLIIKIQKSSNILLLTDWFARKNAVDTVIFFTIFITGTNQVRSITDYIMGLKKACLWSNMSGILMVCLVALIYPSNTGHPYSSVFSGIGKGFWCFFVTH